MSLPSVPVKHDAFLEYVQSQPDTPISDLVKPYNDFDAAARKLFAQGPSHSAIKDNHVNIVPIYNATGTADIRVRARNLASENPEQKSKYLLPLSEAMRRPNGSPAVVPSLDEFQNNFTLFTEGALGDIDWSNVVAAGSAVVTSLLPVPEKYRKSKRGLRQYYHEEFAPASDVDLFLYGLTEDQAIEKIKHIEDKIKNTILYETTTIRTKNTITIASQYPTRHVQIVLRIYHSVAEILTGFDVDCSCAAYDGKQVYASPRAIASYISQINQVDLTRRSPSYENRLSKYSHRGFEVYWAQLDRSRVDPTIFERSFTRIDGLARLLVLEKLPKADDRDAYLRKRREERGRPPLSVYLQRRQGRELKGNLKDDWEDEVPEWQEGDQISNYHTFTIPYGRRYNARKIEKLLYTKDLLLNAQWNQPKDREVYLHRHPAFFGDAENVIGDCCGFCPQPVTEEEQRVAEEESKIYISGNVTFIKDDPGRQEIGSFNPITETDWTEMAYVGRTELLCQAIVSGDIEAVKKFLQKEGADPDRRDYTGRTPLQLACISSTPAVVQCLVDHGARLTARMADGKTALHLAAARGNVEIISILLTKSSQNEAEAINQGLMLEKKTNDDDADEDDSEASTSYVKVERDETDEVGPTHDSIDENDSQPDIYDINTIAWDSLASPLHFAIIHGHVDAVRVLVTSFGADVRMPIKITNEYSKQPQGAILNLVLALSLPLDKAREMSRTLLELGASPAQADIARFTPVHYIAQSEYSELLSIYLEHDKPAVQRAINYLALFGRQYWISNSPLCAPLMNALGAINPTAVKRLLEAGAKPVFEQGDFLKALKAQMPDRFGVGHTDDVLDGGAKQPILFAVDHDLPLVAMDLLERGADPNTEIHPRWGKGQTVLDRVREVLGNLQEFLNNHDPRQRHHWEPKPIELLFDDETYLAEFQEDTYKRFVAKAQLKAERNALREAEERDKCETVDRVKSGMEEKKKAIEGLIRDYETLEAKLLDAKAKTEELHPDTPQNPRVSHNQRAQKDDEKEPFKVNFNFRTPELTDTSREGYLQLFEAAWNGDLDTIKSLTLGMWGESHNQPPLEIAVPDEQYYTCLHIAILRGHRHVAKPILEIVQAQYKPKKSEAQKRFEVDIDNVSSDDEDLNIVGHTVDDQFTHEDIGEVTIKVESKVTPLRILHSVFDGFLFLEEESSSETDFIPVSQSEVRYRSVPVKVDNLLKYAIYKNDLALLDFLLQSWQEYSKEPSSDKTTWRFLQEVLQFAIKLGRTDCMAKFIKSTAVGLPLAKMSETSGVKAEEEPRYYQGLSIRGMKRKDWANAGRNEQGVPRDGRPPLLVSAMQGSLASTEWFLSTTPGRLYLEYVNSHKDDQIVARLAQSKLGLEGSVLNWLQTRNNLVLHCAVMSKPCEESERLVQYLVDHHPECLEVRSSGGHTPLALAYSLHRTSFARILIAAGANQCVRDSKGNSLLHLLLYSIENEICTEPDAFTSLIKMLDPSLVSTMLTQRAGEGSWTPFARWLRSCPGFDHPSKEEIETITSMTTLILDLANPSNQKHLELLDGSGNTPVHSAVKKGFVQVLELMLDRRPDLLYRENATGSTPLEMAVDAWVNGITRDPPEHPFQKHYNVNPKWQTAVHREPRFFIEGRDNRSKEEVMLQICQARAKQSPRKRGLVSLFEANEVAKRLAVQRRRSEENVIHGYRYRGRRHWARSESEEDVDEVALWGPLAKQW